jgi:hypothetical protein
LFLERRRVLVVYAAEQRDQRTAVQIDPFIGQRLWGFLVCSLRNMICARRVSVHPDGTVEGVSLLTMINDESSDD